ncbi:MAG TPA: ABC transporter permease, partial [Gemmatimonadaceae bacterium]|nr:ABC transporter permease [Gemmatimonadaceae bacterium]
MIWLDRLLHRRRIYDDLSDEIRAHLEEKTDELIARGMSPVEAREAARRAFGNVTRVEEDGRESWRWPTIESFITDLRYALRQLRRAPALSAIIVVTLAIGIAATTTVFSWTRSVLLDPLPGAGDAGRVMALETTSASGSWTPTSWLDYLDFRKYLKSFDGLAASYPTSLAMGDDARTERRWGELVSANFFDVLRVRPALGGFFPSSADETQGAQPAVVISYDLWQSRWHGDSAVIGRIVQINRFPFTVVGVAPAAFHGSMPGERIEIWVPAAMLGQIVPTGGWWLRDRGTRTFRVLARLAPGVTFAAARSEVESFAAIMAKANADVSKGMGGRLMPLWQSHWGVQDALRAPLAVLLAACGLVLLIVCANAANLLLARATGRRRELGLRLALGAPRARLVRQLLTEASVLAVTGSAVGLLCTVWLARSLSWLVPSFAAPSLVAPHVDAGVLAFTAILAGSITLLAGIAPALHGSREAFSDALNDGGRGAAGSLHATFVRSLLVSSEMALAVISLVGAGLFYESVRRTHAVSPGFDADHVAMASVSITLAGYDSARGETFLRNVAERVGREPGVSAVSYTDHVPLSVGLGSWEDLRVEGYAPEPSENMKLYRDQIGPGYFTVLGIPLVDGRDFTQGDDSAHAPVMIVNEAFVRHFLAGRTALGVRVHGWGRWFTIVGVAKDVKTYRLTEPPTPYFYVPVRQVYRPEKGYTFLARTSTSVEQTVRTIGQAVRSIDPTVPVFNSMPLADYIEGPLQGQRAATRLLAILAGVASLLAAIGLYGVISYAVAQRTKEIGVRIALGAQRADVLRMVASTAGVLLTAGLLVGLASALALTRLASSMLYSVGSADALVLAVAAATMIAIALVATSVPARRAMNVDPVVALR